MNLFLPMEPGRRRILGRDQSRCPFRSKGFEGNVHETEQVKCAELFRQALEFISLNRIVPRSPPPGSRLRLQQAEARCGLLLEVS